MESGQRSRGLGQVTFQVSSLRNAVKITVCGVRIVTETRRKGFCRNFMAKSLGRTSIKTLIAITAILLTASSTFGAGPGDVLGEWKTEGTNSRLELFRCEDKICGKIVTPKKPDDINSRYGSVGKAAVDSKNPDPALRKRPIIGMEIMKGFTSKGDKKWENGICYNPKSGKSYKCNLHMVSPERLELRIYIWIPLLGRTFALTR